MKTKILIIFTIVVSGMFFGSFAKVNKSKQTITEQSIMEWKTKAPQLFNSIGEIQQNNKLKLIPESLMEMSGVTTNPFGLWDETLEVIINSIPADNKLALRAAILYAKNEQDIYFSDISQEEALRLDAKSDLQAWCLTRYLGFKKGNSIIREIDKFHISTKDRETRVHKLDKEFFGWKILGTGFTKEEENKLCDKGEF